MRRRVSKPSPRSARPTSAASERPLAMPAVSIIIAALEAEDTLGDALASALAQSFTDFEIVIAPDEPRNYSDFGAHDGRIRILPGVSAPTGPGPARNRALAASRGEWIALL